MTINEHWYGPADAPLVVLVHGLGGGHRTFRSVIPLLHDDLRALAVDITGTDDISTQASDLVAVLNGRVPIAVVGHSRGGLVATAMAEREPTAAPRLVLVNTPPTVASRLAARAASERLLRLPVLGRLAWRLAGDDHLRNGLRTAVAPGAHVPSVLIEDLRRTFVEDFLAATGSIDHYLAEAPLSERLNRLPASVQVRIVYGKQDLRVSPGAIRADAALTPRATCTAHPESGHFLPLEAPTALAGTLRALIVETTSRTTPALPSGRAANARTVNATSQEN